jgi:RNA polymerase sigma-70 factor (ECF subfamily)
MRLARRLLKRLFEEVPLTLEQRVRGSTDFDDFEREILSRRQELIGAGLRMTGSRTDAEDLVQDAIMRAWTFWHRFEPGTNGRAWMHRILLNTFINGYRRRKREREVLMMVHARELGEESATMNALEDGLGDELKAALEALPEEFRQVVLLVDALDHSYRDAADVIGCPIGTVMSRLHRARRAMKRQLEACNSEQFALAEAA